MTDSKGNCPNNAQKVCIRLDDGKDIFDPLRDKVSVLNRQAFMREQTLTCVEKKTGREERQEATVSIGSGKQKKNRRL